MYRTVTATHKIANLKKSIRIIQGGTSASKTISILLLLIDTAQTQRDLTIHVVSESMPHMKLGALKDFLDIMKKHGYYKEEDYNRTDKIYKFSTGTTMHFFGLDDPDKARGPRRDILYINEANNIGYKTFEELELRTRLYTILDFNPVQSFWVHERVMQEYEFDFLRLTYKDNEAIDKKTLNRIVSRKKTNPNWYKVYGLGEVGKLEGLIFPNFEIINELPKEAELIRYIVDFGYSNDVSAVGALYKYQGGFVVDQIAHETGMKNIHIANKIRKYHGLEPAKDFHKYKKSVDILTVADSSEPKSIDDLKDYGLAATGATKGKDSVRNGIDKVQDQVLYITASSIDFLKDFRGYVWKVDRRTGEPTNTPEHEFSHSPDAVRYGITDILGMKVISQEDDIAL